MEKIRGSNLLSLFLIIILGATFRMYNLGTQSIWHDEAREYFRANKSVSELWRNQRNESNPPMYDILLGYSLKLLHKGKDEFSLRLFPSLAGILLIPLAFAVGRYIFNTRVGLFFSILVSISPLHIYYSQDAKMYSFLMLLSLGSFFLYYLSLSKNTACRWMGYVVVTVAMLYTHNYGVLIFVTQALLLFIISRGKYNNVKWILISHLAILFIFIPRVKCMMQQMFLDFNPWILPPSWSAIAQTFAYFFILVWNMQITFPLALALIISSVSYGFILGALFFNEIGSKRLCEDRPKEFKKLTFLTMHLFLPIAIAFLISFKKPIYVAGRYSVIVLPYFYLLASYGLDKIKKDIWRSLLLGCIIMATLVSLYHYYFIYKKSNDRQVASYLASRISRDDILIFTGLSWSAYRYYQKGGVAAHALLFPDKDLGWMPRKALDVEPVYTREQIDILRAGIESFLNSYSAKIIVLYTDRSINGLLIEGLKKHYRFLEKVDFKIGKSGNQVSSLYFFQK